MANFKNPVSQFVKTERKKWSIALFMDIFGMFVAYWQSIEIIHWQLWVVKYKYIIIRIIK